MFRNPLPALLCAVAACAAPEPDADPAEIDALWARYEAALVAGDLGAYGALYSENGRVAFPGQPTVGGRDAIRANAAPSFEQATYTRLAITSIDRRVHGTSAYEFGSYEEDFSMADTAKTAYGRFSAALAREADGSWTIDWLVALEDSAVSRR